MTGFAHPEQKLPEIAEAAIRSPDVRLIHRQEAAAEERNSVRKKLTSTTSCTIAMRKI
jgi:hypothetical protein